MRFTLAPDLAPIVRHGVIWLDGATVAEREPRMNAPIAATEADVRVAAADAGVGGSGTNGTSTNLAATTAAVRSMYKRVGLDPTKTRPSSEALLRRVRKGDPFPRVNA